jgi:MHS family proline/betaine transporter-like MFS transporter
VRPFGALLFGNLGDKVGRKHTFLITLIIMGGSTFAMGCIPTFQQIGYAAPLLVLLLRLLQGLALGGEYGGAATYVAEYAPIHKRGYYTSFIQTTATLGLFVSLLVILTVQQVLSKDDYANWGWRIPFLASIFLVLVSIFIRLKMHESPMFTALKQEGKTSKNPLKESFSNTQNFKMVLLALFAATMGQGVVWYTSQFYAQTFLLKICNIESTQANTIIGLALLAATPFFIVWGYISDKIKRSHIILAGMLLAAICYRPIFKTFYALSDVATKTVLQTSTKNEIIVNKPNIDTTYKTIVYTTFEDNCSMIETKTEHNITHKTDIKKQLTLSPKYVKWVGLFMFILVFFVTMVYGPIAAFLVELFPTQIRYTSMSLPYHVGNGVFGGLVPFIATLITTNTQANYLSGLWYPIGIALFCFVMGVLYLHTHTVFNSVKKNMGIIIKGISIIALVGLYYFAFHFIEQNATTDIHKPMPWIIILTVFTPILIGLYKFGSYVYKGLYKNDENNIPELMTE